MGLNLARRHSVWSLHVLPCVCAGSLLLTVRISPSGSSESTAGVVGCVTLFVWLCDELTSPVTPSYDRRWMDVLLK